MKIAVIGRGLIGSAAVRYLAEAGLEPLLIGPTEPTTKSTHQGVFGSHYDEGRITRHNATELYWSDVSAASIARYRDLEKRSGVPFFSEVGALMIGRDSGSFMQDCRHVARRRGILHRDLSPDAFRTQFPDFAFYTDTGALWEELGAGHISPRNLVAAQTKLAAAAGAVLIGAPVLGVEDSSLGVKLRLSDRTLVVDRVLVAAGGMTDHVLGRDVHYEVRPRTITFFHLDKDEAQRLAYLPSAVIDDGHYFLPPIRYPDGSIRMKLGGEPDCPWLRSAEAIGDWFRGGGDDAVSAIQRDWVAKFLPDVHIAKTSKEACITTWTENRRPDIRHLSDRIALSTAGNGAGAKCSDELGRQGAALILETIDEKEPTS